jgi:hypothetical protein
MLGSCKGRTEDMPQIWMTYDELAKLCDCTPAEARMRAVHLSLDRRKSRDGATRVKLDLALTARFFATIRDSEFDLDGAIDALRDTHRQMAQLLTLEEVRGTRGAA